MPKLTVAQYADKTARPDVTIETGVTFRVRTVRNSVQRQWRYRYTLHGRRDEITLPASGSYREHMAADHPSLLCRTIQKLLVWTCLELNLHCYLPGNKG